MPDAKQYLVGRFSDPDRLLAAIRGARAASVPIHEVYTPYVVHGIDQAMGLRRSRLGYVTMIGGLAGALTAAGTQFYCAVMDWPINVGGKPANSSLAFLPITFELTVLFGGLLTFAAFLWRSGLRPAFSPGRDRLAIDSTNDTLALVLDCLASPLDGAAMRALLTSAGADDVREEILAP